MILSHKHKFIFFCNPKTGSTSVEKALELYQEGDEFNRGLRQFKNRELRKVLFANKHLPPAMLKAWVSQDVWNNYYKFVFVRNPWDWFVSEWKYHFRLNKVTTKQIFKQPYAVARHCKNHSKMKALNNKRVFEVADIDYLFEHLKRNFSVFPSANGLFQSHYVYDIDGNQIVDRIAKFENIQTDFQEITANLNLNVKIQHLNKTNHSSFQSYFTKESQQRVAELWREDIERFEYTFD